MTTDLNTIFKLYNIDEIAEVMNISKTTLYRLVQTRKIPFYKIKGCVRFSKTDILEYLENHRIKPVE